MNKLLIFDLDGTLFDTFYDIYNSLKTTLQAHSYPVPTEDEARLFVGDGLKIFIARATGFEETPNLLPHDVLEYYLKHYSGNLIVKTKPYDGIVDCIKMLYDDGYTLAVLSNKSEFLVKRIIDHFDLSKYFHTLAGGDTFIEKKPSPLPILSLLNSVADDGIDTAIMIGDSSNDILSAKNANSKIVYCKYGYGKEIPIEPDYVVDSAKEIYNVVKSI